MRKFALSAALGLAALAMPSTAAFAGPITVDVSGARNQSGIVRCGLFASPAGWREPGKEMVEVTSTIQAGRATCTFRSVPSGTFAIAVFHAERNERTIETGLFGKPKQGVGFSRNPSITFGPPNFQSAAFTVGEAPARMSISLSY